MSDFSELIPHLVPQDDLWLDYLAINSSPTSVGLRTDSKLSPIPFGWNELPTSTELVRKSNDSCNWCNQCDDCCHSDCTTADDEYACYNKHNCAHTDPNVIMCWPLPSEVEYRGTPYIQFPVELSNLIREMVDHSGLDNATQVHISGDDWSALIPIPENKTQWANWKCLKGKKL